MSLSLNPVNRGSDSEWLTASGSPPELPVRTRIYRIFWIVGFLAIVGRMPITARQKILKSCNPINPSSDYYRLLARTPKARPLPEKLRSSEPS